MNDKIGPQHLKRKAKLYVRQSSIYQVQHNEESRRLQYAMQERLRCLGWTEIEVIDEDLGRSASGNVTRAGFDRLIAEVCLGEVGAVAAREVSRFARNSREWQKLVEVCRMVDTLLVDQETNGEPVLEALSAGYCQSAGTGNSPSKKRGGARYSLTLYYCSVQLWP